MRLLAGLGNPGREYEGTRHNAGFLCVDAVARKLGIDSWKELKGSLVAKKGDAILVKPQKFMNLSGDPIRQVAEYYGVVPEDICVVADDVYLAPGSARIRHAGSDGGHNGWKSVGEHMEGEYRRVRIGIGIYEQEPDKRAQQPPLDRYVLQRPPDEDAEKMAHMIDILVPNLILWLERGDLPEQTLHI